MRSTGGVKEIYGLTTSWPNNTSQLQFATNRSAVNDTRFASPFNEPAIRATFVVLYVVVFALCVFGNLVVLLVILRTARMRTRTNFFLANLAVADLSVGVFCVIPTLSSFISQEWLLGRAMCKLYYYVNHTSYTTSIVLLTVISVERYIAILFPLKAQHWITIRRLKVSLIIIWLVSGVYNTPILFIVDSKKFLYNLTYCFVTSHAVNIYAFYIASMVVWYVIPLALMSFMYARIAIVLWQSGTQVCLNQATSAHRRNGRDSESTAIGQRVPRINRFGEKGKRTKTTTFGMRHSPSVLTAESQILNTDDVQQTDAELFRVNIEFRSEIAESEFAEFDKSAASHREGGPGLTENRASPVTQGWCARLMSALVCCDDRAKTSNISPPGDPILEDSSSQEWSRRETTGEGTATVAKTRHTTLAARKKVIRLLLSVVISFSICVLPYHINVILVSYGIVFNEFYTPVSYLILYLNSGLNPILYALLSENFRKSLKEILCYRCC